MNRVSRRSAAEAAEALLEAGRTEPVLDYDVELGLARHQDWLRNDAPVPDWAHAGAATANKSLATVLIKTIVSSVLVGALATAAWQAPDFLQPSAADQPPSSPSAVATQPSTPDTTATPAGEAEAAMAPIPIPVPEHAVPSEHAVRRVARADASDKRATRHRARAAAGRAESAHVESVRAEASRERVEAAPQADVSAAEVATPAPAAAPSKVAAERAAPAERKAQAPQPAERKAQQPEDLIEMQQVATAEQLLERSPARALALVREGDKRFARGYFQQERAYIAIMALIRLGRTDEARSRAASFAKQFPALPYGARIRSALDAASRDSTP